MWNVIETIQHRISRDRNLSAYRAEVVRCMKEAYADAEGPWRTRIEYAGKTYFFRGTLTSTQEEVFNEALRGILDRYEERDSKFNKGTRCQAGKRYSHCPMDTF